MKSVGKATGSSMKAMVHALQPKAVGLGEILDTWKIEQVLQCTYICRFPLFGALVVRVRVATAVIVYTFFIRVCASASIDLRAFRSPAGLPAGQ